MSKDKRERSNGMSNIVGLGSTEDIKRKRLWMFGGGGLILLLGIGGIAANGWLPQSALLSAIENVPDLAITASAKTEAAKLPTGSPTPQQEQMTAELVTITPRGFEPNVIRRPAGRGFFRDRSLFCFRNFTVI